MGILCLCVNSEISTKILNLILFNLAYNFTLFLDLPVILNKLDDAVCDISGSCTFTIRVKKTKVPVKIDFMKDEKTLKTDSVKFIYTIDEENYFFTLNVFDCQIIDAGLFTFVVSNVFGSTSSSGRLLIKCNNI